MHALRVDERSVSRQKAFEKLQVHQVVSTVVDSLRFEHGGDRVELLRDLPGNGHARHGDRCGNPNKAQGIRGTRMASHCSSAWR